MEIPDILVVNKADHPRADDLVRELRRTARFRARKAPIVRTNALTGEGITELAEVIAGHRNGEYGRRSAGRRTTAEREIVRLATDELRKRLERVLRGGDEGRAALDAVAAGRRTPETAARWLIAELTGEGGNR
jgi:LAO/AO transport system kinase